MKVSFTTLLLLFLVQVGFSQELELIYEVIEVKPRTVTQGELSEAKTIVDINPNYPESWVKSYVSVEITTSCAGDVLTATSNSDQLSEEQRDILKLADPGTDIIVDINYYPENTLSNNAVKNIHFSFGVIPKTSATYSGGQELFKQYLQEHTEDAFASITEERWPFAVVEFIIDEQGQLNNSQVSVSSKSEAVDALLLQAVNNMEAWIPAVNSKGEIVTQALKFIVGYPAGNCMAPLAMN